MRVLIFWSATPQTTRIGIFVAGNAAFELDESSQTSDDEGLVTFTLDGKQAVLIDPILLCTLKIRGAA